MPPIFHLNLVFVGAKLESSCQLAGAFCVAGLSFDFAIEQAPALLDLT